MLQTNHRVIMSDSREMSGIANDSIALVVTSPPYPMVTMWDEVFCEINPEIADLIKNEKGYLAFKAMHHAMFPIWQECVRVLKPGGLMVINIGDATRKLGQDFQLFENHAEILRQARELGLQVLPDILWRKPNNSPNKFLGSGMLPPCAYVTYEHEYVLVLRKGGLRKIPQKDRAQRRQSAYFWEERNQWFSDLWIDLPGVEQGLSSNDRQTRSRSAAYPLELPWRLIQMFSIQGDTVLDPFLGTGTTSLAAMISARNSIGFERDPGLATVMQKRFAEVISLGTRKTRNRFDAHRSFIQERIRLNKIPKHMHQLLNTPVITAQETDIRLYDPIELEPKGPQQWQLTLKPFEPPSDDA